MKLLILILLYGLSTDAQAEPPLLSIDLKHRHAEELIPLLRPLAGEEATVAGRGPHLFLRAEPARLEELQLAIQRLDTPAQQLGISVYQGSQADLQRYMNRRLDIRTTRDRRASTQRIMVLEGNRASIAVGRSVPQQHTGAAVGPAGLYGFQGTAYRDTEQGFYVLPRIHGEDVSLEITPFSDQAGTRSGEIQTRRASTRLRGRIGEWLSVGSHAQGVKVDQQRPVRRYGTRSRDEWNVFIRVELMD